MDVETFQKEIELHIEDAIALTVDHLKYDNEPCGDSPRMAILTRLLDVKAETGHLREVDLL
jgi:hypothetical protein